MTLEIGKEKSCFEIEWWVGYCANFFCLRCFFFHFILEILGSKYFVISRPFCFCVTRGVLKIWVSGIDPVAPLSSLNLHHEKRLRPPCHFCIGINRSTGRASQGCQSSFPRLLSLRGFQCISVCVYLSSYIIMYVCVPNSVWGGRCVGRKYYLLLRCTTKSLALLNEKRVMAIAYLLAWWEVSMGRFMLMLPSTCLSLVKLDRNLFQEAENHWTPCRKSSANPIQLGRKRSLYDLLQDAIHKEKRNTHKRRH